MINDILALAASSGTTVSDVLIFAGVPILIALVTGIVAIIRGLLRFTQFMARSEAAQRSTADTNIEIRDKIEETNTKLTDFAEKTNSRLGAHDQALAVLNFVLNRNGDLADRTIAQANHQAAETAERLKQEREFPDAAV